MPENYLGNKIEDIGSKYLGLGLYKLIKLTNLYFDILDNNIGDIWSKYLGLGLYKLI